MPLVRPAVAAFSLAVLADAAAAAPAPVRDRIVGDRFGEYPRGSALQLAIATATTYPLGTAQNPVRVTGPHGERVYLLRLRCPDGTAPESERLANTGLGPYRTVMTLYQLRCGGAAPGTAQVFMDPYHRFNETAAVPGFGVAGVGR